MGIQKRESPAALEAAISSAELARLTAPAGSDFVIRDPHLEPREGVLQGRFDLEPCGADLGVHATAARELHDLTTEITLKPSLTVSVVLQGGVDFDLDGRPLSVAATPARAQGQIWTMTQPTLLTRRSHRGTLVRKVHVSLSPGWIEAACGDAGELAGVVESFRRHLAHRTWRPSARARALAEQILRPPPLAPFLVRMQVESRALEIAAEAFQQLAGESPAEAILSPRDRRRAARARDCIEAHLDAPMSLAAVASATGMSVSTLQRIFKAAYGATVVEYLRARRLDRARQALIQDAVSVGEAAYIAGYASQGNFATAFKRAFGVPPTALRH